MKCDTCRKEYTPECAYGQGRCPHHPAVIQKPYPTWLLLLAAPFIIGAWIVMNPRRVWEQARKEYDF